MSSSTWRVLSGYATYQRTPLRMTSGGKCAPLKLIAIVVLPHDGPLAIEGDHTAHGLKGKLATKPPTVCCYACAAFQIGLVPGAGALLPGGVCDIDHSMKRWR